MTVSWKKKAEERKAADGDAALTMYEALPPGQKKKMWELPSVAEYLAFHGIRNTVGEEKI